MDPETLKALEFEAPWYLFENTRRGPFLRAASIYYTQGARLVLYGIPARNGDSYFFWTDDCSASTYNAARDDPAPGPATKWFSGGEASDLMQKLARAPRDGGEFSSLVASALETAPTAAAPQARG